MEKVDLSAHRQRLSEWHETMRRRAARARQRMEELLDQAAKAKTPKELFDLLERVNDVEFDASGDCTVTGDEFEELRKQVLPEEYE